MNDFVNAEPGLYYIGDLCYLFSDSELSNTWDLICDTVFENENDIEYNIEGHKFYMIQTEHGDGEYFDNEFSNYYVDSGSLGAMSLSTYQHLTGKKEFPESLEGAYVVDFLENFDVGKTDFTCFGHIKIDDKQENANPWEGVWIDDVRQY